MLFWVNFSPPLFLSGSGRPHELTVRQFSKPCCSVEELSSGCSKWSFCPSLPLSISVQCKIAFGNEGRDILSRQKSGRDFEDPGQFATVSEFAQTTAAFVEKFSFGFSRIFQFCGVFRKNFGGKSGLVDRWGNRDPFKNLGHGASTVLVSRREYAEGIGLVDLGR